VPDECENYCSSGPLVDKAITADAVFGRVVDLSADNLVVGAPQLGAQGASTGAAFLLARDASSTSGWASPFRLTPFWLEVGDEFGASVTIDSDRVVVGSPRARVLVGSDAGAEEFLRAGRAFVFQPDPRRRGAWVQIASVVSPDPGFDLRFGTAIDISGDTLVVGEPSVGKVHIFQRDQGGSDNWGLVRTLAPSIFAEDFGSAVSIDGDLVLVGARTENAPQNDSGAAYIFGRNQGGANQWGLIKRITASNAQSSDRFGSSVAVSGDIAAVGAPYVDGDGTDSGLVYLFARDQGGLQNWGEIAILSAEEYSRTLVEFGCDVSLWGDSLLVGAPERFALFFNPGAAYLFQRERGPSPTWTRIRRLVAPDPNVDDQFGTSVALHATLAAVGADYRDDVAPYGGAVFVMDVAGTDCNANSSCDSFDIQSGVSQDVNSNGVPDECEALCLANIVNSSSSTNVVDIDDLLAVISAWGPCPVPPNPCPANIVSAGSSAGVVDIDDLLAVISAWGPCP
jgi:hypothetical protein